ncbi:hypothetical protein WR25_01840 [Diploscapter pachys]|uniref:Farnesyl pyrophosphate synthase n=1 Tax=Diploscapter pachys TaxID=2018661 RepID=A0A2A2JD47_9BILA|nr:hypothetical protein WR25_01840 [Diploscapter pachys]
MCRALIESALRRVCKRFMNKAIARFPKGTLEHDIVNYKALSLFKETVFGGKYGRAQLCIDATKAMLPKLDEAKRALFDEVASTIEIEQTFYLIADDIMDGSETRRGKLCWYKRPEVGLSAINDCFLLEAFIEDILRDILSDHPNVDRICEAYRKSKRITLIGQLLDTNSVRNLDALSWQRHSYSKQFLINEFIFRYELLVEHKTSHYSFFNPIEMALFLADYLGHHQLVRDITYKIGFLFQAQASLS